MSNQLHLELVEQFIQSAINAAATVKRISRSKEDLNTALLKEIETEQFVLLAQPDDVDSDLFSLFRNNEKVITDPTREQLKTIRTGITDSFCGIAKTGSVCISITKKLSSPISMLTKKHIVIVDSKTIVQRPSDVFSEKYNDGKGLSRSFSFVTGPSATADMGPLVRGVHGPGNLHIIVLE